MSQAAPSCPPPHSTGPTGAVTVVGPQFLVANPVEVIITRKSVTVAENNVVVTDGAGNEMFKVKRPPFFNVHDTHVLLDHAGNPVATLRQQVWTAHRRWKVYRGDSSDEKDFLFEACKTAIWQLKAELEVYLRGHDTKQVPDFMVKGSLFQRNCTINIRETDTIIAEASKNHSDLKDKLIGKGTYAMTVYPNVDYAFVVALMVIMFEVIEDRNKII